MIYFLFNWFVKITGWFLYLIVFKTKIYYKNKKVQSRKIKGKAIIYSNHTEVWDVAQMMFLFPTRTLRCIVAELMYEKNFFMTAFLKLFGGIKVDRNSHDFNWIEKAQKVLDKGGVIEIYPESYIPKGTDGTPVEFKPSVTYLAIQSGAPLIPVYTDGNYFSKKRAKVIIGEPVYVRDYYDDSLSEQENLSNITNILRDKIIDLKNELEKQ